MRGIFKSTNFFLNTVTKDPILLHQVDPRVITTLLIILGELLNILES